MFGSPFSPIQGSWTNPPILTHRGFLICPEEHLEVSDPAHAISEVRLHGTGLAGALRAPQTAARRLRDGGLRLQEARAKG